MFNDIWAQKGHSVSCMTILFIKLQISKSDIRPHIEWGVSLVILHTVTSIFLNGLGGYIYGLTNSLYHPRGGVYV